MVSDRLSSVLLLSIAVWTADGWWQAEHYVLLSMLFEQLMATSCSHSRLHQDHYCQIVGMLVLFPALSVKCWLKREEEIMLHSCLYIVWVTIAKPAVQVQAVLCSEMVSVGVSPSIQLCITSVHYKQQPPSWTWVWKSSVFYRFPNWPCSPSPKYQHTFWFVVQFDAAPV